MRSRQVPMTNRQSQIAGPRRDGRAARRDCFLAALLAMTGMGVLVPTEKTCLRERKHGTEAGGIDRAKQSQSAGELAMPRRSAVRNKANLLGPRRAKQSQFATGEIAATAVGRTRYDENARCLAPRKQSQFAGLYRPSCQAEHRIIPTFQYSSIPSFQYSTSAGGPVVRNKANLPGPDRAGRPEA